MRIFLTLCVAVFIAGCSESQAHQPTLATRYWNQCVDLAVRVHGIPARIKDICVAQIEQNGFFGWRYTLYVPADELRAAGPVSSSSIIEDGGEVTWIIVKPHISNRHWLTVLSFPPCRKTSGGFLIYIMYKFKHPLRYRAQLDKVSPIYLFIRCICPGFLKFLIPFEHSGIIW